MVNPGKRGYRSIIPVVFLLLCNLLTGISLAQNTQAENILESGRGQESRSSSAKDIGDEADAFFDDSVHEIRFYFNDSDWYDTLYESHANDPEDPYFPVRFEYEGIVLDPVGISMKGFTSFNNYPGTKKSFRIDFNEFQEGKEDCVETTFFGLKKLNLNNGYLDPTMLREKLFLDLAGNYVPAVRASFARLHVNDEYYGFYTVVEHIDKTFIQSRYDNYEDGNLFRAEKDCDLSYAGQDQTAYSANYELKTNLETNNWSDLIEFTDILNNIPSQELQEQLDPIFDVESWLYVLGLNNLMVNLDSYTGSMHNYYLYDRDDTGQITHLLWDTNLAFGTYTISMTPDESKNPAQLDPFWTPQQETRPLMGNIWAVETYNATYLGIMAQLLRECFNIDTMEARVLELADLIRDDVYNDTRKQFSNMDFETALLEDIHDGNKLIPGLLSFVEERAAWLDGRLDEFAADDVVLNELMVLNDGTLADDNGDHDPWVELYNPGPGLVELSGFYLTNTPDEPGKWQLPAQEIDDGEFLLLWLDNEPAEGDDHAGFYLSSPGSELLLYLQDDTEFRLVDKVSCPTLGNDISYGRLPDGRGDWTQMNDHPSPDGQNLENAPPELFINEFMADNEYTFPDPNNATLYPDWIELYNADEEEHDMGGKYLTDDLNDPKKWMFPDDTMIEGGSYLLILANNNTDPGALNTAFKLNVSGDEIGLFETDGKTLIDSVEFGKQTSDISYGRFPDGSDSWLKMFSQATPGSSNEENNDVVILDHLFINEFMADNDASFAGPDGSHPDWIELYNGGNESIDLSGMYLTDDPDDPTKWQFPNETAIKPEEFLLVWADNDPDKGALHTNFGLDANGESISLFAADGETLIDSIEFDKQIRDVSFGRYPDGGPNWEHFTVPTPGWANGEEAPESEIPLWVMIMLVIIVAIVVLGMVFGQEARGRTGKGTTKNEGNSAIKNEGRSTKEPERISTTETEEHPTVENEGSGGT